MCVGPVSCPWNAQRYQSSVIPTDRDPAAHFPMTQVASTDACCVIDGVDDGRTRTADAKLSNNLGLNRVRRRVALVKKIDSQSRQGVGKTWWSSW